MPIEFYASSTQQVIGPVVLLPQAGSTSGGSKRPLNSWAILRGEGAEGRSILLDAPVSWAMEGIRALARDGHPPTAMVLSHRDLAGSGDAFDAFAAEFDAPVLMHPADQAETAPRKLDIPFGDPTTSEVLRDVGIEVIPVPGHSPGSVMLYLKDEGGILLAGDSAVGPGPEQDDRMPRLQRPVGADRDPRFVATWKRVVADRPLAAILPLHGAPVLRAEVGDAAFDALVADIWEGEPMDPSRT